VLDGLKSLGRKDIKKISTYVKGGVPIGVFSFLYSKDTWMLDRLLDKDTLEEFSDTSTSFPEIYYILEKGGKSYMNSTAEQIRKFYKQLIQSANKYCEDNSLHR